MSYIVEYTTLSGKRIPIPHKIFETAESAEAYGSQGVEQGNYRAYTVVETKTNEGYKVLPPMDKEKYQTRDGLEGPFSTLSGKVVYYDPKEGKYYDPDTDMYMSYDEFRRYDDDYKDMEEGVCESVEALKQIVADKSAAKVHGVMVDMFTASAIMQVYDAVSDKNKASMEQMLNSKAGLMKMADFAMKQINEWGGDDQYEAVERAIDSAGDWFYSKLQKGEDQLRARMEVHAGLKADLDDLGAGEEERNQAHKELEQVLIDTMNQFDKGMAEGCSPHKKGSAKYKKHMAAKHAAMGESESVTEGVADEAAHMERDHEVQMARSDLYKIANYAVKLHKMLKNVSEEQGIQGWMQAKITKAADYMSSVAHTLEYDMMEKHQSEPMSEGLDASKYHCKDCGCQMHNCKPDCNCEHDSHDETGSWWVDANGNGVADAFESIEEGFKIRDKSRGYGVSDKTYKTREEAKKAALMKMASTGSEWEVIKEGKTASQHRLQMINKIKKSGAVKSGSMSKDDKKVEEAKKYTAPTQAEIKADQKKDRKASGKKRPSMTAKSINKKVYNETTTAGGIATAPMPMGKMIKRKKK